MAAPSSPPSLVPASLRANRPAVFLDRDGTLNVAIVREGQPFPPQTLDEFRLYSDVAAACRALKTAGYVLVVATNQPDVDRGLQTRAMVDLMHKKLQALVPEIDRIEACYDSSDDPPSPRRKPAPGMLLDAASALGLDLAHSWIIGDRWRDIDCGKRAGVRAILIDHGYHEKLREPPDFTVRTFAEAAAIILDTSTAYPPNCPLQI